jgi:hypothetical protein
LDETAGALRLELRERVEVLVVMRDLAEAFSVPRRS